ncbi:MAG: hypothetical protein K6C05_08500, partial [Anaerovibrio sp.]|uniref:hypothetical protein n=1 Tax=Anaerovibrio sp. TaxID=1872532 RepID=UPI0025ED4B77
MKKNLAVSFILIVCMLCAACSLGRDKADVGMKNLTQALLTLDKNVLSQYGETTDPEKDFMDTFVPTFQKATNNALTPEQAKQIGKTMIARLAQVEVKSVSIVSEKDNSAEVKITIDTLDGGALEKEPSAEENKKIQGAAASEKAMQGVLTDLFIDRMNNAKKIGTSTMTVKCKYNEDKDVWEPLDMEKFIDDLYSNA